MEIQTSYGIRKQLLLFYAYKNALFYFKTVLINLLFFSW